MKLIIPWLPPSLSCFLCQVASSKHEHWLLDSCGGSGWHEAWLWLRCFRDHYINFPFLGQIKQCKSMRVRIFSLNKNVHEVWLHNENNDLGGGFKDSLFSPLISGEMIPCEEHIFQRGPLDKGVATRTWKNRRKMWGFLPLPRKISSCHLPFSFSLGFNTTETLTLSETNIAMGNPPFESMYLLLEMVGFPLLC